MMDAKELPPKSADQSRFASTLGMAALSVYLVLAGLILPLLARLSASFMTFHQAEMSPTQQFMNAILFGGWLAITLAGSMLLWLNWRASMSILFSVWANLASLLIVTLCGIVGTAVLVAPMFAILSALNA